MGQGNMDEILRLLHWNRTDRDQARGLEMAERVQNLKGFFQPMGENGGKAVWENCAVVLCRRSDRELFPYVGDMLLWLQDLNWPGAERILQRLGQFQDRRLLSVYLRELIPYILMKEDTSWAMPVAELCRQTGIQELLPGDRMRQLLRLAEEA